MAETKRRDGVKVTLPNVEDGDGRRRAVIEGVAPEVDCGRYPIKRTVGEKVVVEADIFTDGHDALSCVLLYRREPESEWSEVRMRPLVNDRWRGEFVVGELGRYRYALLAWVDAFQTWRQDLAKRVKASQDVAVQLAIGAQLVEDASRRATGPDAPRLKLWASVLGGTESQPERVRHALDDELVELMDVHPDRRFATVYDKGLAVVVDGEKARFSTWYELFPRSAARRAGPARHVRATVEARLPYVAAMGFDVLYLPPIHPIGHAHRKGRNNAAAATPDDPGSPWAIGAERGRAQGDPSRSSARSRTSAGSSARARSTGSRSRSTSPSSARPTTPTSESIRSGSAGGRTARSSTPRTRRRSTRTSIRSTSRPRTGASSGRS